MAAMTNDQFSSFLDIVGELVSKQKTVRDAVDFLHEVESEMKDASLALYMKLLAQLVEANAKNVKEAVELIGDQAASMGD